MDGWVRVLRPFNNISVISRRWKGEHERLRAMKRRLGSKRISPPAIRSRGLADSQPTCQFEIQFNLSWTKEDRMRPK